MTGCRTRRAWSISPRSRARPLQTAREDRQDRKDDAVVEREEKFRQQIWRITVEDKKAKLVHPGDFGIGELAVSPMAMGRLHHQLHRGRERLPSGRCLDAGPGTGATRQLTDGPGGKFHPVWTPDSAAVLFTRPLNPELSYSQENLFSVALADKAVAHLTPTSRTTSRAGTASGLTPRVPYTSPPPSARRPAFIEGHRATARLFPWCRTTNTSTTFMSPPTAASPTSPAARGRSRTALAGPRRPGIRPPDRPQRRLVRQVPTGRDGTSLLALLGRPDHRGPADSARRVRRCRDPAPHRRPARRAARADGAGALALHHGPGLGRRGLRRPAAQLPGQRGLRRGVRDRQPRRPRRRRLPGRHGRRGLGHR